MEPSRGQFIVNLPHNSSPTNTPSHFRTQLPHLLKLDEEWEVALYSIIYPKTWGNVPENEILIWTLEDRPEPILHFPRFPVSIPEGWYETETALVAALNKVITPEGFHANLTSANRLVITGPTRDTLEFDEALGRILGVGKGRKEAGKTIFASKSVDLTFTSAIYVYTDIIEAQITGDRHASLLQSVPASGKFGDILQFSPRHLLFLPLRSTTISNIEIKLTDVYGDLIRFERGDVIVQMLFRRSRQ